MDSSRAQAVNGSLPPEIVNSGKAQAEIGGLSCGAKLMDRDNLCMHPLVCQRGAARLRPHRAVTTALGRGLKATGAEVDYERWIPHLYQLDERGAIKAAQLDIAAVLARRACTHVL